MYGTAIISKQFNALLPAVTLAAALSQSAAIAQPQLSAEHRAFLDNDKNVVAISTNPASGASDWSALATAVGDRRIVLLGEFTHGARELAALRNDIIRHLHAQLGFDVVLIEAGIGEQIVPDTKRDVLSAEEMTHGLFGAWRTQEFREMMQYIRDEGIAFAGYDVQRTGRSFANYLRAEGFDSAIEGRYGHLESALRERGANYDSLRSPTEALIAEYRRLQRRVSASHPMIARVATNRAEFLDYMLRWLSDGDWNRRWAARDSMMAANVAWFVNTVYPGRKVVVVGHNFHVARHNTKEEVVGEYLARRFGDDVTTYEGLTNDMYAVGFFAGSGSYADNSGNPRAMDAPDSTRLDLKHVIGYLAERGDDGGGAGGGTETGAVHFLNVPQSSTPGSSWLFEDIVVNDTFIDLSGTDHLRLAPAFDGLVLLQTVSPPE